MVWMGLAVVSILQFFGMALFSQLSDYIIAYKFIKTTIILNYFYNRRHQWATA
jgi:hypothetical protein